MMSRLPKVFLSVALLLSLLPADGRCEVKVFVENGKFGIGDTDEGTVLVRPRFDELIKVTEDFYLAKLKGDRGAVDASGATIIPFHYSSLNVAKRVGNTIPQLFATKRFETPVSRRGGRGRRIVSVFGDFQTGLINQAGEVLIPLRYDSLTQTGAEGFFLAGDGQDMDRLYGLVDLSGEVILPLEYDRVDDVRLGPNRKLLARVTKKLKEETISIDLGPDVTSPGRIERFRKEGLYGFRTGEGKELCPPSLEDAWDFKNGFARVKRDGKWGFLARDGKMAVEPRFNYAWDFEAGKAKVRLEDGSVRYVDPTGKLLDE